MKHFQLSLSILLDFGICLVQICLQTLTVRVELLKNLLEVLDCAQVAIQSWQQALFDVNECQFNLIKLTHFLLRLKFEALLLLFKHFDLSFLDHDVGGAS